MIRFAGVEKRYGQVAALRGLSLEVAPGELMAVVGASGSGKSTLLRLVNRLVEPSAGRVEVDGKDIAGLDPVALRRTIGMVFQRFALFPHLSVARNVAVVPSLLGWAEPEIRARVDELLSLVGLPPGLYRERLPSQLSGGQQQRVGVARALAARPRILLLDEPFGAVDPIARDALGRAFRALHEAQHLTSVMVTHDMAEALLLADRVAVMHEGGLLQVGTPAELMRAPQSEQVRALLETPRRQAERLAALSAGETP